MLAINHRYDNAMHTHVFEIQKVETEEWNLTEEIRYIIDWINQSDLYGLSASVFLNDYISDPFVAATVVTYLSYRFSEVVLYGIPSQGYVVKSTILNRIGLIT